MSSVESDFLGAIETHSTNELEALIDAGLDVRGPIAGKPATRWLIEMYARSDGFPRMMRILLDRGAPLDDPRLEPVLLDDGAAVSAALRADPALLAHRTTLASAFTPLREATLLHVAAEYGTLSALDALLAAGAEVDARAGSDEFGLGGQTPLFHTVNSNANRGLAAMRRLLDAGARADVRIAGLIWGEGLEWETALFDLTPLSYAQCGLLPQFHRKEEHIRDNVALLLATLRRPAPPFRNVPNRYLAPKKKD